MIICPARILLNTFHIFRSAGEQFLLFPGISALGHFVPKLSAALCPVGRRACSLFNYVDVFDAVVTKLEIICIISYNKSTVGL